MKLHFKLLFLMLITSITLQAQKHQIYSKSFDVNEQTTAIFNLDKTTVSIEESKDDKIHFDYNMEFINYSKKEIDSIIDNINVGATMFENNITLQATSSNITPGGSYSVDEPYNKIIIGHFMDIRIAQQNSLKSNSIKELNKIRKSKNLINKEINKNTYKNIDEFLKYFKSIDKKGKGKSITEKNVKAYLTYFVIRLPYYVKLSINGKGSNISFKNQIFNELIMDLDRGFFKAASLSNPYNKIKADYLTRFRVEEIIGGDYTLKNIIKGLIGSIENAEIVSEFSKIEIGEIGENVTITDFNSKYWFYNFSNNFKRFDIFSEYSKIHLFYPETDFSFEVFGNNTINHIDDIKIEMQPTRNGEKFHMMSRKANGKTHFSGAINFDIIHGVIYTYNDTFKPNKN
ncbi:MAG: hypothetical protein KAJ28_10605 [Flavobacteriaceae bacterium]|nr:hypothetical protein [Flavobacteriaceae bacterium]